MPKSGSIKCGLCHRRLTASEMEAGTTCQHCADIHVAAHVLHCAETNEDEESGGSIFALDPEDEEDD